MEVRIGNSTTNRKAEIYISDHCVAEYNINRTRIAYDITEFFFADEFVKMSKRFRNDVVQCYQWEDILETE